MLNQVQIAMLPAGFHPTGINRRTRKRLAARKKKGRVQIIESKDGSVKRIVHREKTK